MADGVRSAGYVVDTHTSDPTKQPTLCACGCGERPRSVTSVFVPGHHMRIAPRQANGRSPLPVRSHPPCACGCGEPILTVGRRFRSGHQPQPPPRTVELLCPACGTPFVIKQSEVGKRTYCSRPCRWSMESTRKPDNPLKARVLGKMRAEHILATQAAAATGINHGTFKGWLGTPGRRLQSESLRRIAAWLSITPAEAERLQGGSAEERQRDIMLAARYSPAWAAYAEHLRVDPAYRRRIGARIRENREEKPWSTERRQRLGESIKRAFARSGYRPTGQNKKTLHGRAHTIRVNLRRWHPRWTPGQIEAETIRRLMAPPYNVKTIEAAASLLTPRRRPKPHRRHTAKAVRRCQCIRELDVMWPRTESGFRKQGFWEEVRQRIAAMEGETAPDYQEIKIWWSAT